MTDERSLWAPLDRQTLGRLLTLIALSILASATTFANHFVQDDIAIIARDEGIHSFSLSRIFLEPYWPAPFFRDLYRPFASSLFAAEWWAGGGSPLTYRIVSVTLYAACALACYGLARRLLPANYAFWVAAIFAVHPVHVEAVAVGVNQGELIVGLILVLMTTWYIEQRLAGPLGWRAAAILASAMFVAALFKEHGVVLPALLVAVECFLLREPPRLIDRLRQLRPTLLLSTLGVVLLFWPRSFLFKDFKGSFTAEGLLGLNIVGRTLTMLQVVPRWIYLTIWPMHLQADYSPKVIEGTTHFGIEQLGGVVLIALLLWLAVRTYKKSPVVLFGLSFAAIAILPVSNILIPTGIVMAERTLFIPSFGALIALGGLVHVAVADRTFSKGFLLVSHAMLELVIVLGLIRSITRHMVWHDPMTLAVNTVKDAPLSYRGYYGLGTLLIEVDQVDEGEKRLKRAIELSPGSTPLYFALGDAYRTQGNCESAIPYYVRGLSIDAYPTPRAGLIACRVWVGDYVAARDEAMKGLRAGENFKLFSKWLRIADSAIRVKAPPKTVLYPTDTLPSIRVTGK